MAKPAWVATTPSSGSGNGTVSVSGTPYTGRLQRSGTITVKATGTTDATASVVEEAIAEFVQINNTSVAKAGGTVTVTGTSNSTKLNFALNAGSIVASLPATYSAGGATTSNNTAIAGDPGATAQYNFSIALTATANGTTSEKTQTLSVTANGGQSAQATLTQAAGDPTLQISPTNITLNSNGDAVSLTVTSNTNWTVE
jgi:hypothetical protein